MFSIDNIALCWGSPGQQAAAALPALERYEGPIVVPLLTRPHLFAPAGRDRRQEGLR